MPQSYGPINMTAVFKKLLILSRLLRVNNWIKNILIVFPFFFGKKQITWPVAIELILAFLIFSFMSSCIYIINDLGDINEDRNHPVKKLRPIAAGQISMPAAGLISLFLFVTGTLLAVSVLDKIAIGLLLFYLFFNLLYTFYLKHLLIIDFYSIAIFFEIRLFYGGVIAGITISHWLALTVFFLATLIAIGKRRDDVVLQADSEKITRKTTKHYNLVFLDTMIVITSSLLVFIYIIYSVSDWVVTNYSQYFYLSDIFVVLGLTKYLHKIFVEKKSGNPIKVLFEDGFILTCVLLWVLMVFIFIYYGQTIG
jgi:decaprenyl-phosphate phosphoribosyltransferase